MKKNIHTFVLEIMLVNNCISISLVFETCLNQTILQYGWDACERVRVYAQNNDFHILHLWRLNQVSHPSFLSTKFLQYE